MLVEDCLDDRITTLLYHPERWWAHIASVLCQRQRQNVFVVQVADRVKHVLAFQHLKKLRVSAHDT